MITEGESVPLAKALDNAPPVRSGLGLYYALFFISGIPALLYQIVWQRSLFAIYGVNIESVTVIVSVFILGLGVGSLAGGALSKRKGLPFLRVFGLIEITISIFGYCSLSLFHSLAVFTAGAPALQTALSTILLLFVPTLLMGSTLPLMVAHIVSKTGNVGQSVGSLYSVNTFGSSVACFAAAFYLMNAFGETGTVRVAASLNLLVALSALSVSFASNPGVRVTIYAITSTSRKTIHLSHGLWLSAATGFVSLGYEILWYRFYSWVSGGTARSFAVLLGAYLAGIAFFSIAIADRCLGKLRDDLRRTLSTAGTLALFGGIAAFLVGPAIGATAVHASVALTLPLIFAAAGLLGGIFPVLSHATLAPEERAGSRLSYLYLANILGSALGSFLVGFVLMDHYSGQQISIGFLVLCLVIAGSFFALAKPFRPNAVIAIASVTAILLLAFSPSLFHGLYERMFYGHDFRVGTEFAHLVENRSGVIAVDRDGTAYGGGVYDGTFSTDLVRDRNGIWRAFAIAAFRHKPTNVLVIGLATGSWAQVIANNPEVSHMTIVEINPGYLPLIRQYPAVASLLSNPKVDVVIDDGRRWLVANPHPSFDLIVINSTFSWRAHATNLLSIDFLQLSRKHLNRGGILYYNTTWSPNVLLTGAKGFPYMLRVGNFAALSDSPIIFDRLKWESALRSYQVEGSPVFNIPRDQARFAEVLSIADTLRGAIPKDRLHDLERGEDLSKRLKGATIITDDNMGDEWR